MKKTIKVLAIVMTLALVMSLAAVSAFALEADETGKKTSFQKSLGVDEGTNFPDVDFAFTITPGTAVPAGDDNALEIKAGLPGATIENTAHFDSNSPVANPQPADAESGKVYAVDDVVVDFTNVTFTEPGVYRYVITETATTNLNGFTNDPDATRYLDVFVFYNNETPAVLEQSYSMRKTTVNSNFVTTTKNGQPTWEYASDPTGKSSGYTNKYDTFDLEFKKSITGNQADPTKRFAFTLQIDGANPGYEYTIQADQAVLGEGSNVTNGKITMDQYGSFTGIFYLTNNDVVKVLDLPKNSTYEVTEVAEDYTSTEGIAGTAYTDDTSGTMTEDIQTGYTNDRSGITPTGVIITVAPFAIGILVFGAVILYMISRRRRLAY